MTRQEQAYNKIQMFKREIVELNIRIKEIYNEIERLNYYYMDNPNASAKSVGKEIKRLRKLIEKTHKKIECNEKEINKLALKYNIC